jgi:hypothetical protein
MKAVTFLALLLLSLASMVMAVDKDAVAMVKAQQEAKVQKIWETMGGEGVAPNVKYNDEGYATSMQVIFLNSTNDLLIDL